MNANSKHLRNSAEALLNGDAIKSIEGQNCEKTAETWLFEAWSCGSVDGTLEALMQALELEPENELAQQGVEWVEGLSSLAQQVMLRSENSLEAADLDESENEEVVAEQDDDSCLLYTSPSPRDRQKSRMPSSA